VVTVLLQGEESATSPEFAQGKVSDLSSASGASVVCSSDEASHECSLSETVEPSSTTVKAERFSLPEGIEDDLDDADGDIQVDVSNAAQEDFLQIYSKVSEQRNSYRKKCMQVG